MNESNSLTTELKHLGLSDKEACVYLASLELGPASVQDISHKSKVNRATTYVMIESLSGRGLMSAFTKGKKKLYASESPERLMSIIDHERNVLDSRVAELNRIMPMLGALYNAEGVKPAVRYLEGVEGLETSRLAFERLEGDFIQIFELDQTHAMKEILTDRDAHLKRLMKRGVSGRVLAVADKPEKNLLPQMPSVTMRFVSSASFPIHGSLSVRANHVFLFSHKSSVVSAILVSQEIADVVRALFEMAWVGSSKFEVL
jgi:HTH-type transcriptional regulator, sugar sensing transcriptional regulator